MSKRIIFKNNSGGVSVITPVLDCGLSVQEIALKDVPTGKPFKIVNAEDIPSDRTNRDSWVVDSQDLTDGVGE